MYGPFHERWSLCGKRKGLAKMNRRPWPVRLAHIRDVPALEILIPLSVRTLQIGYYSTAQMEAALGPIFAVDRQLILDETYYVVDGESGVLGCGGWSRRRTRFGPGPLQGAADEVLDPRKDAARIRAFFVHPEWARRGIAGTLLDTCEEAIRLAGFRRIEIVATLPGEPLYRSAGYEVMSREELSLRDDLRLPVVKMQKAVEA